MDCNRGDFSKDSRDDAGHSGEVLFYVLFSFFLIFIIIAVTVTIAMLYNRKTKSKMQMAILYAFANMTLLGREILFLDVFLSGTGFTNSEYLFFSSFSTYTFLMTALAY